MHTIHMHSSVRKAVNTVLRCNQPPAHGVPLLHILLRALTATFHQKSITTQPQQLRSTEAGYLPHPIDSIDATRSHSVQAKNSKHLVAAALAASHVRCLNSWQREAIHLPCATVLVDVTQGVESSDDA